MFVSNKQHLHMEWIAAIAEGANLISDWGMQAYQYDKQRELAKKQRQHEMRLAEYAFDKNREMWDIANQYNLPANQMARLRSAGLNPNLVYGKGATTLAATQLPKYQAPKAEYPVPQFRSPQILAAYQNMRMNQAQIDNVKANTNLTNDKSFTESFRQTALGIQNQLKTFERNIVELDYQYWNTPHKFDGKTVSQKSRWEYHNQRMDLMSYQAKLRQQQKSLMQAQYDLTMQNVALKKKDLQHYWYRTYGPVAGSIVRGASRVGGKFIRKAAAKKLKMPKAPTLSQYQRSGISPNLNF